MQHTITLDRLDWLTLAEREWNDIPRKLREYFVWACVELEDVSFVKEAELPPPDLRGQPNTYWLDAPGPDPKYVLYGPNGGCFYASAADLNRRWTQSQLEAILRQAGYTRLKHRR